MVVSGRVGSANWPHPMDHNVVVDPARIAYGVMAGIGFLGGGAIIKSGGEIRGLTTAAGLWCVTAIGLAAGLGLYLFAAGAAALVLAALWGLDYVEKVLPRTHFRTVTLRHSWEPGCVRKTVAQVRGLGYDVKDWTFERTADPRYVDVHLRVAFGRKDDYNELESRVHDAGLFELLAVRET